MRYRKRLQAIPTGAAVAGGLAGTTTLTVIPRVRLVATPFTAN